MEQTLRVRTAVRVVCKNRLWLPHLLQTVDEYLAGRLSDKVLTAACEAGATEHTLEYLLGKTISDWKEAVQAAVRGGHTHVLRWMTERDDGRGPWKFTFRGMLQIAAMHGNLDAVQWLIEWGMDWHTLAKAGRNSKGYIEKSWRYEHCTGKALNVAAEHGHFEVVKWIYDTRTDICSGDCSAMNKAVENGHCSDPRRV